MLAGRNGISTCAEVVGETLTVYLPESLVGETRAAMMGALVAALSKGGIERVRFDAAALVTIDAAGIGALVRASRIAREHTGSRPVLTHFSDAIQAKLIETAVLPTLVEPATE